MKKVVVTALGAALVTLLAVPAQANTYTMDPSHTFVTFEVSHFGTSTNRGRFDKKQGAVELDPAAKTGKVSVTFETGSLDTGFDPFTAHLKSKDFFNVAQYPTAKFESDKVVFEGSKVTEVPGQLTLLGKTQPVTLKATNYNCYQSPMLKREVCGGDFVATIKRSQWGMDYGVAMGMPDDVRLVIQVEAIKQ